MRPPYKSDLRKADQSISFAQLLHPHPRFYKHEWQVFTLDSELEGDAFLREGPRLSTAACMQLLEELTAANKVYFLYARTRPRRFPGMPFDPKHPKWQEADWAPALEDDPDPEWNGYR